MCKNLNYIIYLKYVKKFYLGFKKINKIINKKILK